MYAQMAQAAQDQDLRFRVAACLASLGYTSPHPLTKADEIQWAVASSLNVAIAYGTAISQGEEHPGSASEYVTDQMILNGVRAALGIEE